MSMVYYCDAHSLVRARSHTHAVYTIEAAMSFHARISRSHATHDSVTPSLYGNDSSEVPISPPTSIDHVTGLFYSTFYVAITGSFDWPMIRDGSTVWAESSEERTNRTTALLLAFLRLRSPVLITFAKRMRRAGTFSYKKIIIKAFSLT
jgi:hypothetical protein